MLQRTLELSLRRKDPASSRRAAQLLREHGGARAAARRLLELMEDGDPELQAAAYVALFQLDPQAAAAAPFEPRVNLTPIASVGGPVDGTTALAAGDYVELEWNSTWYAGRVLGFEPGGGVRVHYLGWSDRYDEVVPRRRLRVPRDWNRP